MLVDEVWILPQARYIVGTVEVVEADVGTEAPAEPPELGLLLGDEFPAQFVDPLLNALAAHQGLPDLRPRAGPRELRGSAGERPVE